jgi:presenilin-like A22 family membrane protease
MKHNTKITLTLVSMFLITQMIGLFVINVYNNIDLPYGFEPPEEIQHTEASILSIIFAFIISLTLFFFLTRINAEKFIRIWFFFVVSIAIALTLKSIFFFIYRKDFFINEYFGLLPSSITAVSIVSISVFLLALPISYYKIFKRNLIVHNITELFIYPGIAAVFLPILTVLGIIILLLMISLYDIWAVWHSKFMQNMAKYQINNLKFFTGFFIPYADKRQKQKIKLIKEKYSKKSDRFIQKEFKKANVKVNLAILGGGDIIFPIIAAGVFYKFYESLPAALIITFFSTLALLSLFILARKGRFYPAMPFLTIGIYIGMIVDWFLILAKII